MRAPSNWLPSRPRLKPGVERRRGWDDEYLDHFLLVAPRLQSLPLDPLFAECLVALEVAVRPWYGLLYYGLLDRSQFRILSGCSEGVIRVMETKASPRLAQWQAGVYPFVDERGWYRAVERRNQLWQRTGHQPQSRDDARLVEQLRYADWLAGRDGRVAGLPGPVAWPAWDRPEVRRQRSRAARGAGCRCPARHPWRRPCVVCALPFCPTLVSERSEQGRAGDAEGRRAQGRLSRCCEYFWRPGLREQVGARPRSPGDAL